jgi:hypothetical protein
VSDRLEVPEPNSIHLLPLEIDIADVVLELKNEENDADADAAVQVEGVGDDDPVAGECRSSTIGTPIARRLGNRCG